MLVIKNLTVKFGGLTAINNVSFTLSDNTIFGLIGPNGAGKTTLLNVISGFIKPLKGQIIFKGKEIQNTKPYLLNKIGIARTFQMINLFKNVNILENVLIGMHSRLESGFFEAITGINFQEERKARKEALAVLEFVGLNESSQISYEKQLAGNLDYGNQRRLEIAVALVSKPTLLLLDEPAAGMNSKEKDDLMELLKKIKGMGVTILIIEHDMKLLMRVAESICVLNEGKKIAEGKPEEIQQNENVIKAYLGTGEI